MLALNPLQSHQVKHKLLSPTGGRGTLGIFGRGCASRTLEPLARTTATIIAKSVGKVAFYTSFFSFLPSPWPNVEQNIDVCARNNCSVTSKEKKRKLSFLRIKMDYH